jgi:hypothetical protein
MAVLWLLALIIFGFANPASAATVPSAAELEVFVRPSCPYCAAAE